MPEYLDPETIDQRLGWPLGRAARLARRGVLPSYVLPDGALRFRWEEVEALIVHRGPAAPGAALAPAAPAP